MNRVDAAPDSVSQHPARFEPPSAQARREERARRRLLLVIRMIFLVVLVTASLLSYFGVVTRRTDFSLVEVVAFSCAMFAFGILVITADARTPFKRLSTILSIAIGIIVGLTGAWVMSLIVDLVAEAWDLNNTDKWRAYVGVIKIALGVAVCYLTVIVVLTTKDDFRLVIPYVEFAKQVRGVRPMLLDTSILIDGRITSLSETHFLDAPLIVPSFVIDELQALSDSSDKLKRERGRRGLAMLTKLQASPFIDLSIDELEVDGRSVDHKLIELAARQSLRVLTTDYNLTKVGQIRGVSVVNLNDLGSALKAQVKPGEGPNQGIGYLPDGTMVVVEEGLRHIRQRRQVSVTNSVQTSAGRLIFARMTDAMTEAPRAHAGPALPGEPANGGATSPAATSSQHHSSSSSASPEQAARDAAERLEQLARSATTQPRTPVRSDAEPRDTEPRDAASRRNPRR
jgi:uncharacterized protein YacL